ncbi:MAG: class I SAM-dependent methyltransferase [Vicingus serpentipes]|nr:class I SAM-dependent methyltransferase [Vicingus serpentipes]
MGYSTDALGEALLDYLKGDKNQKIIVTSDITEEDVIPVDYLYRTAKELPEIEQTALKLCVGSVMDVGAGSGVHTLLLQDKGLKVKAIDISKGAVEVMLTRGVKDVENINFFDVTGEKYDTLLFLMNGIGIAGTLEGLRLFLKKAKLLLNDGGRILLDSTDIQYLFTEEDGSVWVDLNKKYYGEVVYQMTYKNITTLPFSWLFVDYSMLQEEASTLGFQVELIAEGDNHHYLSQLSL